MSSSAPSVNPRRLTLFLGALTLFSNLSAAVFFCQLPHDPLYLTRHLSIYSYFASVLSVLGIFGAKNGNGTLVAIFANFLLIDVLICAIPRLLVMAMFGDIRGTMCSADSIHDWLQDIALPNGFATMEAARSETTVWSMQRQCMDIVWVLQLLVGALAITITGLQMVLALRVSAYARRLQRNESGYLNDQHGAQEKDSMKCSDTEEARGQ